MFFLFLKRGAYIIQAKSLFHSKQKKKMRFDIDSNQCVFIDSNDHVRFCHYSKSNVPHILSLNKSQFHAFSRLINRKMTASYSLGQSVWFYKKTNYSELMDKRKQIYFRFYTHGWKEYKKDIHYRILSFLHKYSTQKRYKTDRRQVVRKYNDIEGSEEDGEVSTLSEASDYDSKFTKDFQLEPDCSSI